MLISQTFMLASPWLIFLWVTHLSCFSSFFGLYLFIYSRAKVKHVANAQRTTRTVIYSIISKTHFAALLGCCCRLLLCDKYYFSRNVKRADLCTFIIIIKRLNLRSVDRSDYAKWQFIHYHFRCTLSSLCVRSFVRSFVRWFVQMLSLQELKFALLCKYVRSNRVIISRPPDCSTGGACLEKNKTPNVQTSCCQRAEARPKVERSLSRAKLK